MAIFKRQLRTWHRQIAIIVALPLSCIILSGLGLQLRNQFEDLQPKTVATEQIPGVPLRTLEELVSMGSTQGKVEQIIYRPGKHALAIRLENGHELQLHPQTGALLKNAPRRSGWLIDLHQGSLFGPLAQYGVFILTGWGLLALLISGVLLYPKGKT